MSKWFQLSFIILVYSVYSESKEHQCRFKKNKPTCELFSETIEGPYYLYYPHLIRRNIREDKKGKNLQLKLKVINVKNCKPLQNVRVDIWQPDATGNYSSYEDAGSSIPPAIDLKPEKVSKVKGTYLRGTQFTNRKGFVKFDTLVPSWYPGRTAHIHVELYLKNKKHKGQFYFTDNLISKLARRQPYKSNLANRITNSLDCTYLCSNGISTTLNLEKLGNGFKAFSIIGLRTRKPQKHATQLLILDGVNGKLSQEAWAASPSSSPISGIECKKTGEGKSELYRCKRLEDKLYRNYLE